jgi:hypothetical protein
MFLSFPIHLIAAVCDTAETRGSAAAASSKHGKEIFNSSKKPEKDKKFARKKQ